MTPADRELALRYAPIIHFDEKETIPLRAIGYTVFRETKKSASFPKRAVEVPANAQCVIEYAYYYDYDIGHMYDLEHIWVTVGKDGHLSASEASFHGKYLVLLVPGLQGALEPTDERVHAFCQPGKHAFLPVGDLFRLVPQWDECCDAGAGGPVLVGGPFGAGQSPAGKPLYAPTDLDNRHSVRYLKENLAFRPSLRFVETDPDAELYMPWEELFSLSQSKISKSAVQYLLRHTRL